MHHSVCLAFVAARSLTATSGGLCSYRTLYLQEALGPTLAHWPVAPTEKKKKKAVYISHGEAHTVLEKKEETNFIAVANASKSAPKDGLTDHNS